MIFCVLKPYFTIFCCFRPDCCIIQKKLLPCYFRSSSISINTQGHWKHILSFIFLLQQEGWSWMIWSSGRRDIGDREVNWAEPEFLPLSEYSKQAWSNTGIFVCFLVCLHVYVYAWVFLYVCVYSEFLWQWRTWTGKECWQPWRNQSLTHSSTLSLFFAKLRAVNKMQFNA